MRRPRRKLPGQFLDVAVRCLRGEFRLVPEGRRRAILGFWLAKAQASFPRVQLLALCQMSNHLHLVLRDHDGQISDFMQYFLGHAAKAINRLDHVRGNVFERRFAAIVILDDDALAERIAYVASNPIEAGLVRQRDEWPGLCAFATQRPHAEIFTVLREGEYGRALRASERTGVPVFREDYFESATLSIPAIEPAQAGRVLEAVEHRARELARAQPHVLGARRALQAAPFDRPKLSHRSAMPLCFASTTAARVAFIRGWRAFVAAFRCASAELRRGILDAAFPRHSFRPGTPCP